ncbi:DUF2079 domain-containing protein [Couchioplanes azureus]|uniref:DUF2079 domain-containing protein n=1 Tax=Couchioplanes caeruleus TaxID=56438 RepID=UPI00166F7C2D|nr:DUF2079 domain-containing protein [Couchioplanes caeruleus]GGQ52927.1 glycosyl transferase [Couchioplanes caeruleus subsp. azureus]
MVAAVCLGASVWVTSGLWADPLGRTVAHNEGDHAFFEWLLGYGVRIVTAGADPFHTDLLNAPVGVNLAANTSVTAYAVVFAPLTRVAGPQISYVVILTLNLAASAFAWYLLLRRHAVRHRAAAVLGGLFCGFAPGWVSHANGHLNWTAGWLAPVILWWVLRRRTSRRRLRDGIVLGVLLAAGFLTAAEMLMQIALATGVFVIVWSCGRVTWPQARAAAPAALAATAVGALVAGAVLAYPLYLHFAGPGSFRGSAYPQRLFAEDAAAYLVWPDRSVAALLGVARGDLAPNPTEATSFFGAPLLVLVLAGTVLLWWRADPARKALLRALTVVGLLFAVLSLGPRLRWLGEDHDIALPYAALTGLPLFDAALPARFALTVAVVIGTTLALLADRLLSRPPAIHLRVPAVVAHALALVPLVPTPVPTVERTAEPRFVADGTWQRYAADGEVITALPHGSAVAPDAQRWQAYTMARGGRQFRIPEGYFLGPGGRNGAGRVGAPGRRAGGMWTRTAVTGHRYDIDNRDRYTVRSDLAYWKVRALFVPDRIVGKDGTLFRESLVHTLTELFGPGERAGDVLLWRVRPGIDPAPVPGDGPDGPPRPTD